MAFTKLAENILALAKDLDARTVSGAEPTSRQNITVRNELLDASRQLSRELITPFEFLSDSVAMDCDHLALRALVQYDVPNLVADAETPTPIADIAKATPISEEAWARLLRGVMVHDVFAEPKPGFITHTRRSRALRDPGHQGLVSLFAHYRHAFEQTIPALEKWGSTVTGRSGWNLANPDEQGAISDWLERHPEEQRRAAAAFGSLYTEEEGADGMLSSKIWKEIDGPGARIVDLGGAAGHLSIALADKVTQECTFVVQDLPESVNVGIAQLPTRLQDRVSFLAHDYFTPQPIKDADVYLLRQVMHAWSDDRCVDILRNLVPALKAGARVVISERIPAATGGTEWVQRNHRWSDLLMMAVYGGKDRDEAAWREVFAQADARYEVKFEHWEGSLFSVVEAVWKP